MDRYYYIEVNTTHKTWSDELYVFRKLGVDDDLVTRILHREDMSLMFLGCDLERSKLKYVINYDLYVRQHKDNPLIDLLKPRIILKEYMENL